ncbi:ImuA family protein [Aurantiacibacter poecillastricola]|uniref:ImuA family protein n=1 Tax=Aurantiacibacter poecillastricola TaxID=3064385 RepID=UPI00273DCE09|nr:recA-like protein [Aurantiacibacter sp. 219JJ12-13]MDP5261892.1 recA-like protein [Aurantiacibacter sp. 219JJ12-13]
MDTSTLPKAAELACRAARNQRWQPDAPLPLHSEIFAPATQGAGAGAALAFARDALCGGNGRVDTNAAASLEERSVLWVQDARAINLGGRPYRAGLPETIRHRLIHVAAETPEDALFAMEEGLRCRDLAAVVGEVMGNPRALDFTASRRLTLTAEKHGVPLLLVRLDAEADLSSARMRWRLTAAPSAPPRWNIAAPGRPSWRAELFRARSHPPGEWILRDEPERLAAERFSATTTPDHGDLVRGPGARSLAAL